MAIQKTATTLDAGDVGRLVRFEYEHAAGIDLTVFRLLEVRPENGIRATVRTSVLIQNTGYCFEAREDKGSPRVEWLANGRIVHVLEGSDARDVTGCFCPGDCGCHPSNGRPNCCGCTGQH